MSQFSIEYLQTVTSLQSQTEMIRNISIIAHVDHGKTTLCDSLLAKAGVISLEDAGEKHAIASTAQEKNRQITIKSIGISLPFKKDDKQYIINLVDSPGHVDFSSEVTAALRITDGALIVVDCVEGVCVQTETVTRQALSERIKPVLHINKVDRGIMELKLSGEALYQKFNQLIESVNVLLSTYQDSSIGVLTVDPRHGSVSFGSGKQGWAFTIPQMAKTLAEKSKQDIGTILPYLWGDNYFDPETKKFTDKPISKSGKPLVRYVVHTILNPILKIYSNLYDSISKSDMDTLTTILPKIGLKLSEKEKNLDGNKLMKSIMQKWLPAADALVGMIIDHLPPPNIAQRYRVENLYTGPLDDEYATAIRNCDPEGPLMMFVSKMIDLKGDGKRYHAFGRVFSGTVRPQQEVFIMGPDYVVGEAHDFAVKRIPGTVLIMGSKIEPVMQVPCGNTVGIQGLEKILVKSGTISSSPSAYPISPMKFSVSPVVRRAVSPQNPAQLKKFTEALRRLEKSDPCLLVITTKGGEFIIAGAGELHIEVALGELQKILGEDVGFTVSPPVVGFCETVSRKSSIVCLGKSPNKHNRLYMTAQPLGDELTTALEQGKLALKDSKIMIKQLVDDFGWDKTEASKIWYFVGSNCIVDSSRGVQYLNEIKDHIRSSFEDTVQQSALCGEPMRGIRFDLLDAHLHSDTIHRGPGQIIPTASRLFFAAVLSAEPRLVEPVYLADVQTEQAVVGKIYSCVAQRRGSVVEETPRPGTPLSQVKAYLPVVESFGFASELREATSGRAFPQLLFDHWQMVQGDLTNDSLPYKLVMEVRRRKGLKFELPTVDEFNDKL